MSDSVTLDTAGEDWTVSQTEHDGTVVQVRLGEEETARLKSELAEHPVSFEAAVIKNALAAMVFDVADARQILAHPKPVSRAALQALRRHQSTDVAMFAHHALKGL